MTSSSSLSAETLAKCQFPVPKEFSDAVKERIRELGGPGPHVMQEILKLTLQFSYAQEHSISLQETVASVSDKDLNNFKEERRKRILEVTKQKQGFVCQSCQLVFSVQILTKLKRQWNNL